LRDDADFLLCEYCSTPHFPDPNPEGIRVLDVPSDYFCSLCAVSLIHATAGGQRILYCERCHGSLISMGIFSEVVHEMRSHREVASYQHAANWKDLDRRMKCPKCSSEMDTHPYCGPGNVIIDSCEECGVNWLDYGELDRIVRAPDPEIQRVEIEIKEK
jgi:Zn-finger nucleic acid-binding protein